MRVLICDDHAVFRDGIRQILSHVDVEFVEADSADGAVERVDGDGPLDLVLLDLHMPGDGWQAFERLRRDHADLPVVIVSSSEEPADVRRAIEAGASGYIPKSSSREVLRAAFDLILAGGVYAPPAVLMDEPASPKSPRRRERASQLTPRQLEVLTFMAKGLTNREIAGALGIAEGTVKSHVATLFEVLDVTNRTEAALVMRELGLEITEG